MAPRSAAGPLQTVPAPRRAQAIQGAAVAAGELVRASDLIMRHLVHQMKIDIVYYFSSVNVPFFDMPHPPGIFLFVDKFEAGVQVVTEFFIKDLYLCNFWKNFEEQTASRCEVTPRNQLHNLKEKIVRRSATLF